MAVLICDYEPDDFDRLHPLAVMHGVVCAMLENLEAYSARRPLSRGGERQQRALAALRDGLAAMVPHRHDASIMVPAVDELCRLLRRCARTETGGLPLETLILLAEPWPWGKLVWSMPGLSLIAVMRVREALENLVVATVATEERTAQLRTVLDLETALRTTMTALASRPASAACAVAHERADEVFFEAEAAIGDGLVGIFAAEFMVTVPPRPAVVH